MAAAYISSYKWQTSVWRPSDLGQARYTTLIAPKENLHPFPFPCFESSEICLELQPLGLQQPDQSRDFRTLVGASRRWFPTPSPGLTGFGRGTSGEGTNVCKVEVACVAACQCGWCDRSPAQATRTERSLLLTLSPHRFAHFVMRFNYFVLRHTHTHTHPASIAMIIVVLFARFYSNVNKLLWS